LIKMQKTVHTKGSTRGKGRVPGTLESEGKRENTSVQKKVGFVGKRDGVRITLTKTRSPPVIRRTEEHVGPVAPKGGKSLGPTLRGKP